MPRIIKMVNEVNGFKETAEKMSGGGGKFADDF